MEIKTLKGIDQKRILNAFNDSFYDYFIPLQLTEEQLNSKIIADKIDLKLSVGVFENQKLIAFILHGFDIIDNLKVVYNGGTGVIPEKRGSGLTKRMYHFILPILKENGINKLQLEVITENIPAISSYKKSGYSILRELVCYNGKISISSINDSLEIKKLNNYNWDLMESFWDIYPTWQNSKNVITQLKPINTSLGAYFKNQLVAYVIYNPRNNRLQQIAVSKNFRQRKIASSLVHEIIQTYPNALSIINVDKSSKCINTFLQKIGFENHLEQLEMELKINNNFS